MPKLYSARQVINTLKRNKFEIISQKGSHIKLIKKHTSQTFTVIVPNHSQVARGTFNSILKQANMTIEEFKKNVR